jgi:hypothetical protein
MKELTSKKTGKVNFLTDEVYEKLSADQRAKYRVREIAAIRTRPPVIEAPEKKIIEPKKVSKK